MEEGEFVIPYDQISNDALLSIIKDYILREGTDYGAVDLSMESKTNRLLGQIKNREVFILFNSLDETCNIVTKRDLQNQNIEINQ
jgi:hypothetical protein